MAEYPDEVGARLRRIRAQQGLSLQDVERRSGGRWKAAVIGSYERGDRNISASRLCELAEFYGVAASELLPRDDAPRQFERSHGIVLDLTRLDLDEPRWSGLKRYCQAIQVQRGDFNGQMLSVRSDDLRALAVIMGTTPEDLVALLRTEGVLRDP